MRLLIVLVLFVTWTVCLSRERVSCLLCKNEKREESNNTKLSEKDSTAIRVKRTLGSPSPHPSPKRVNLLTKQTSFMAYLLRTGISLERIWFDVMSHKSTAEVVTFLVLGIVSTFFIILTPLVLLAELLAPPLIVRRKRNIHHEEPHLDFSLPQWMDQMESWMNTPKPLEESLQMLFPLT